MTQYAKRLTRGLLTTFFAVMALSSQLASAVDAGDMAPDFTLQASDGETYSLSQFKGVRPVVIAFFPKAFTGG